MENTGDRSWAHLADTEHFGRQCSSYTVISKSEWDLPKYNHYTHAGHCMVYSRTNNKAFGIYNTRAVVLMQMRFDGYLGFPGGLIDEGEDVICGVNRELAEEMNVDINKYSVKEENYIVSHLSSSKKLILHFYALELPIDELKSIEENSMKAPDYGEETLGIIRPPLYTMGDGFRGFPAFLSNSFAGNAREQLLQGLIHLKIMTPEEIVKAEEARPLQA